VIVYGDALEVPNVVIDYEKCDTCINCLRTCPMQVLKIKTSESSRHLSCALPAVTVKRPALVTR